MSVILTASNSFGNVTITAPSIKDSSSAYGAAGTVYLQKQGQALGEGVLIIDNYPGTPTHIVSTLMPEPSAYNDTPDLSNLEAIIVTNKGVLWLNTNTIYDFGANNLQTHDFNNSTVVVGGTNNLSFPDPFTVSTNYRLLLNTTLSMVGDWIVPSNAVLSHFQNEVTEAYKLGLVLDGNLTVEQGGLISANDCGYKTNAGPAYGGKTGGYGAGYGGMGGVGFANEVARPTYGSITAPTNLGSGAAFRGGGAIFLDISGTTTVHGAITVRQNVDTAKSAGNSGGSIFLRSGHLFGTGFLDASGKPSSYSGSAGTSSGGGGGGGRISVILTEGESFDAVQLSAKGGPNTNPSWVHQSGAAGTIYTQTKSQSKGNGLLLIANDNRTAGTGMATNTLTLLPAPTGAVEDELRKVTLVISNQSYVTLTTNLTVGDLFIRTNTVNYLYLKGWTLTVNHNYHSDWGDTNFVVYDGGEIIWVPTTGSIFTLR